MSPPIALVLLRSGHGGGMTLKDWVFKDFFWEKRVGGGKKKCGFLQIV